MIGGGITVGYSTTAADSLCGKSLESFSDVCHGNLTSGASSDYHSRMNLVDSWRDSFKRHSYDKHVSVSCKLGKFILNLI